MPVFLTRNHTVNRMPVFLTENHIGRILVYSTEIAQLVICLIFSTKNATVTYYNNFTTRRLNFLQLMLCYQNMYNWSRYNYELELLLAALGFAQLFAWQKFPIFIFLGKN